MPSGRRRLRPGGPTQLARGRGVKTRQISVFVANRAGRLASVARVLRDESINIRALSLADAPDFGIFRLIVEDVDRAVRALKSQGFVVDVTDVVGVEVEDRPGALAEVLELLAARSLNVEYMYAFLTERAGRAIIFLRFEDPDAALEALHAAAVPTIGGERLWRSVASGSGEASAEAAR